MELNLSQTKLVGLTMQLDLKAREYKMLCNKLEQVKQEKIQENDDQLIELLNQFKDNHDEIVEIKKQLNALDAKIKQDKVSNTESTLKNNYSDILSKRKINNDTNKIKNNAIVEIKKENIFVRFLNAIKAFFIKK